MWEEGLWEVDVEGVEEEGSREMRDGGWEK